MKITKTTLFWLGMSAFTAMPLAQFAIGNAGIYLMGAFSMAFMALWVTYPKAPS